MIADAVIFILGVHWVWVVFAILALGIVIYLVLTKDRN